MIRLGRTTVLALIGLVIVSCGGKKQEVGIEEKPIPVTIAAASISDITITKVFTGTLEGWKQAKIYASIPEAVVELPFSEGSNVEAGQSVIILDKEGPSSQLRQANAVFQDAKDNFEKMSRLFEQGAISEQSFNNIKTGLDVAKANYEAARQQVELTSPISGILTDLAVNIGQYAPLGLPLATIAKTDEIRMTIYVDGRSASYLKAGQKSQISVSSISGSDINVDGTVREVSRSADPDTRLFRVEIHIENNAGVLRPGMFARATIIIDDLKNILVVPREAVFFTEGIPKVYTVIENRAQERSIEIGQNSPQFYQIISGLGDGEGVIVLGKGQVESGTLVKIVENVDSLNVSENSKES